MEGWEVTSARIHEVLDPFIEAYKRLEAVANAARELTRQWREEDAAGQPLGWLIESLDGALDALDKEE